MRGMHSAATLLKMSTALRKFLGEEIEGTITSDADHEDSML